MAAAEGSKDFFVSYTGADAGGPSGSPGSWEAAGHTVVMQGFLGNLTAV
jgi:hypothetical protein